MYLLGVLLRPSAVGSCENDRNEPSSANKSLCQAATGHIVAQDLVKGMSHITGGGLLENIPRMLPKHLAAHLNVSDWQVPAVLRWLKKAGGVEDIEFARTFNTGLGMVLVVGAEHVAEVTNRLSRAGEISYVVGHVQRRDGEGCVLGGLEAWRRMEA